MAATRKRTSPRSARTPRHASVREERDRFTVVLEDIYAQNKAFGEKLDMVDERLTREVREGFAELRGDIRALWTETRDIRSTVTRIERSLETKVDRAEVESMIARGAKGSRT